MGNQERVEKLYYSIPVARRHGFVSLICVECKFRFLATGDRSGPNTKCDDCFDVKILAPAHTGLCARQRAKLV